MTVRLLFCTLLLFAPLALMHNASGQTNDLLATNNIWDLSLQQLAATPVNTLASGSTTPLEKSASSVTVISHKDIETMAATDIEQVLAAVPGLHISRSDQAYFPKFVIRGITSTHNPEVLMMINGVSIKTLFTGSRSHVWGGMPIKAIERIEVIRGPGSALYGADAFAGVINIVTRSGADIRGDKDQAGSARCRRHAGIRNHRRIEQYH
jgi:outer membrane cobalamin receptor